MPYPERVPVFTEEDICKGAFERGNTCDATRWLSNLFGFGTPEYRHAYRVLLSVITGDDEEQIYAPEKVGELTALILWNESSKVSRMYIAKCLNRCMRRLGYTEYEWVDSYIWV